MSQDTKYVLVTGAAGGIGRAIVEEFVHNGYYVIATDILEAPINLPAQYYLEADLAKTVEDEAYATHIFGEINSVLGQHPLHGLINNAALQIMGGVDTLTRCDWQRTLNVNLVAPFIWTQAFLPRLEKIQGSVVNVSSIHARLTKKNFVAYATSKAALSGMTRALAVDMGPRIRVSAIEPAAIDTDMLRAGFSGNENLYKILNACHPVGKVGQPWEVAKWAVHLVNINTPFASGMLIGIDGAISAQLNDPS